MQRQTLLLFWQASRRYPVRLAISLLVPITTVAVGQVAGPFFISLFFNRLQQGTVTLGDSWTLIVAYMLTQLYGEMIGWRITLRAMWRLEVEAMRDLYRTTFSHLLRQSLGFHSDRFGGSLVSQNSKLVTAYERLVDVLVWDTIPMLTVLVASTAVLAVLFWQYAIVLFTLSVLFLVAVVASSRFLVRLSTDETQASTKLTGRLADVVSNIAAVKSFGREEDELREYSALTEVWLERSLRTMRGFLRVNFGYASLLLLSRSAALVVAVIAVQQNAIPAGTVFLVLTYTLTVSQQLWEATRIVRTYNRALGDAYDMTEILQIEPSVADIGTEVAPIRGGAVSFERVSFAHVPDADALFHRFDLTLAPGERVGLVGPSGSGKTTLTRLLLRFADLDAGAIRIDGVDVARMPQSQLRRAVSYVPQEPLLFHRSLRENIAYGRPGASEQEILAAARKANAWDFIAALPDQLDTLVGERGVKLSGGQRQRIVIARAILKDAPVLVLDEATSALDSESEELIQRALGEAMKGRTTLVIAHRLSTIRSLDRIVVLDGGRVVEQGSHDDLVRSAGHYAALWQRQSGGFLRSAELASTH